MSLVLDRNIIIIGFIRRFRIISVIDKLEWLDIEEILMGRIFCDDRRYFRTFHLMFLVIWNIQLWNGNIPVFIIVMRFKKEEFSMMLNCRFFVMLKVMIKRRRNIDDEAWKEKYINEFCELFFSFIRKKMNMAELISIIIQIKGHEFEDSPVMALHNIKRMGRFISNI